MKKILLLISVLVISGCCCVEPYDEWGYEYQVRNDSSSDGYAFISLNVGYELPEHRVNDFLGTLLLILADPELNSNAYFMLDYNKNNETSFHLAFDKGVESTISSNGLFDPLVTDSQNIDYYTNIISFIDESISGEENIIQIHFRQHLDPTTINFMIMTKSYNNIIYEYVGHALLKQTVTNRSYYVTPSPLPDILK